MFLSQQAPQLLARFLHRAAEDKRIGPRKIHVFEHAMRMRADRSIALPRHSVLAHDHHLARLHIAQVDGVDQIERAGLGGEYVADRAARQFHLPECQRPESVRIARDNDAVFRQKHQRKRAFQLQQRLAQSTRQSPLARPRHQMQDHFGIARSLEDGAFTLQIAPQLARIGDVTVVRHRDLPFIAGHRKRLGVQQHRVAGRRIARVSDGQLTRQSSQHFRREDVGHMAHALVIVNMAAVARRDAGALLAAMLHRVQAQIGEICGFRVPVNGEHAAFVVEFIEHGCS